MKLFMGAIPVQSALLLETDKQNHFGCFNNRFFLRFSPFYIYIFFFVKTKCFAEIEKKRIFGNWSILVIDWILCAFFGFFRFYLQVSRSSVELNWFVHVLKYAWLLKFVFEFWAVVGFLAYETDDTHN